MKLRSILMLFLVAVIPNLFGQDSAVAFEKAIRPFLAKYCVSCHGPDKQKAKLRLDTLDADLLNGSEADMWQEVLDLINVSEMPPEEAKLQPHTPGTAGGGGVVDGRISKGAGGAAIDRWPQCAAEAHGI